MICPNCGSSTHYGLDVVWYVRSMTLPSTQNTHKYRCVICEYNEEH